MSNARYGDDYEETSIVSFYWPSYNIILDVLISEAECSITSRRHNVVFVYYGDDYAEVAGECIQLIEQCHREEEPPQQQQQ